jgi:hypothetical protein
MSDKVIVGTVPNGMKFFSVERNNRKIPVLNQTGDVDFWDLKADKLSDFRRMLYVMDNPEKLKDVTPGPGWGYGEF